MLTRKKQVEDAITLAAFDLLSYLGFRPDWSGEPRDPELQRDLRQVIGQIQSGNVDLALVNRELGRASPAILRIEGGYRVGAHSSDARARQFWNIARLLERDRFPIRLCERCGKGYEVKRRNQRWCGESCRKNASAQRHPETIAKHRKRSKAVRRDGEKNGEKRLTALRR